MSEIFCNQCGHHNPTGSNFCSSCGAPLVSPGEDITLMLHQGDATGDLSEADIEIHLEAAGPALLVMKGSNESFVLDIPSTSIGRSPNAIVYLDDVTVSRLHAEISRSGNTYTVRDLGSLNGTYVNRNRISEVQLEPGDELQVGKFRLLFLSAGDRPSAGHRP
jgi:pSer/pThr/pTyr-binding forkhead associated (FHA) protein